MKIFGKDCLLAEASIDNAGSVVISALAVGALYSFYNNEPAIYINDEDFDVTLLSEVLNDLLLEFVPWKGAIPNTELSEPIEGYEIQCRGAYEPLTQGYCIEVGYLRPTNSYDLYDDGSVIYHMQTHYEALDSDYARGNQLFATVKDAEVPPSTMYSPLLKYKPAGIFKYVVPAATVIVSEILGSPVLDAPES
jgi:hypothetical protein